MNEDLLPSLHHFSDAVESKIEKAEDQKWPSAADK
jgi:hypothetical protein